jgi:succinylglutamate desuccinylase
MKAEISSGPSGSSTELTAPGRVLARVAGAEPGPTVVVVAGIHGNEPAGIEAVARVTSRLELERPELRGRLVALAGNLAALRESTRFVDEDLNRRWTPETVALLRGGAGARPLSTEDREQLELLHALQVAVDGAAGTLYFLDLHTSSAEGPPFLTVGDTLCNRRFASQFPLPLILGLEEQVDGALLEYLNNLGFVTLGVEAGHHENASSVERLEAVLWLALVHAGLLAAEDVTGLAAARQLLEEAGRGIPRLVEVRRRHAISPEDRFSMEPGYDNFHPVTKGQLVARDEHGLVLAPEGGLLLLPLYQGKGNDGFFIAREVRPFWLGLSSLLRRLRLGALLRLLPGVRRHPARRELLVVNTRIARWLALETFHLFGYRKLRRAEGELMFSRRRFDLAPPPSVDSIW